MNGQEQNVELYPLLLGEIKSHNSNNNGPHKTMMIVIARSRGREISFERALLNRRIKEFPTDLFLRFP